MESKHNRAHGHELSRLWIESSELFSDNLHIFSQQFIHVKYWELVKRYNTQEDLNAQMLTGSIILTSS
jgi:hypothetical protein